MSDVAILIPAAGASSRMRLGDKLLLAVKGEALLRRAARVALACAARVVVVVRAGDRERMAALKGLEVTLVDVADAKGGMGASIAAGARVLKGCAILVLPADMPLLEETHLRQVLAARDIAPDRIWRAMSPTGEAGHPVIFPARLQPRLEGLSGDQGARSLLGSERVLQIALPGQSATLDCDTEEDWQAFQRLALVGQP